MDQQRDRDEDRAAALRGRHRVARALVRLGQRELAEPVDDARNPRKGEDRRRDDDAGCDDQRHGDSCRNSFS